MTLMPVSKISTFGCWSTNGGGSRWIGRYSPFDRAAVVDRLAQHVEDAAQRRLAHRHADRRAGVGHGPCRAAGRRWCPWRSRGPGRRPGAAAPRPPAGGFPPGRGEADPGGAVEVGGRAPEPGGVDDAHALNHHPLPPAGGRGPLNPLARAVEGGTLRQKRGL